MRTKEIKRTIHTWSQERGEETRLRMVCDAACRDSALLLHRKRKSTIVSIFSCLAKPNGNCQRVTIRYIFAKKELLVTTSEAVLRIQVE
jgi:hypothetical protein